MSNRGSYDPPSIRIEKKLIALEERINTIQSDIEKLSNNYEKIVPLVSTITQKLEDLDSRVNRNFDKIWKKIDSIETTITKHSILLNCVVEERREKRKLKWTERISIKSAAIGAAITAVVSAILYLIK